MRQRHCRRDQRAVSVVVVVVFVVVGFNPLVMSAVSASKSGLDPLVGTRELISLGELVRLAGRLSHQSVATNIHSKIEVTLHAAANVAA